MAFLNKKTVFKYLAELVVVVVGITGSLLIDEYRQDLKDEKEERKYLEELYRDVSKDVDQVYSAWNNARIVKEETDRLLFHLYRPDSVQMRPGYIQDIFMWLSKPRKLQFNNSTYKELISTGSIGLIKSRKIRGFLLNYYQKVDQFTWQDERMHELFWEQFNGYLEDGNAMRRMYGLRGHPVYANDSVLEAKLPDNQKGIFEFDTSVLGNPNSPEFVRLENFILTSNLNYGLMMGNFIDAYENAKMFREWIGEEFGAVTFEDFIERWESSGMDAITFWEKEKEKGSETFHLLEGDINFKGYEYLENGDFEKAVDLLKLGTKLFPGSFNAFDSLGEASLMAGDTATSIEAYRRSLRLNFLNTQAYTTLGLISNAQ